MTRFGSDVAYEFSKANTNESILNYTESSIYGHMLEAQSQFYGDISSFMEDFIDGDNTVTLSNGMVIDPNSISGMTVFSTHLQLMSAFLEIVNNTFSFVKSFEQKLGNSI
tara:strand:- start:206 stop:535 length:330 start_codon:yes stop_codon:yes gene_type:complete